VGPPCSTRTIGLRLMREAGYDPQAMVTVMQKLEQASGASRPPEFASAHPSPASRIARIKEQLAKPVQ
jgi:predicted Zn-dependent protease